MKSIFKKWLYYFGLEDSSSPEIELVPTESINGTTEYWSYDNLSKKFIKVGFFIVEKTPHVGRFVSVSLKGETKYKLVPLSGLYERPKLQVMEDREMNVQV